MNNYNNSNMGQGFDNFNVNNQGDNSFNGYQNNYGYMIHKKICKYKIMILM